ncbi:MAG TPA: 50S ribosomal protein L32 [Syntrophobacteria bacterium]|nr:50S ribosomal protein L32 [Syntrophobacteria bacterium]
MALPKKRHSRSRRDKRRTHDRLKETSLSLCSQCNEPKLPHHACPSCGTYRGREVIVTKEK